MANWWEECNGEYLHEWLRGMVDMGAFTTALDVLDAIESPHKWNKEYMVWRAVQSHSADDAELYDEAMEQTSCALCEGPLQYHTRHDQVTLVVPAQAVSLSHSWCAADYAHDLVAN